MLYVHNYIIKFRKQFTAMYGLDFIFFIEDSVWLVADSYYPL
jgi:hypothetical protein